MLSQSNVQNLLAWLVIQIQILTMYHHRHFEKLVEKYHHHMLLPLPYFVQHLFDSMQV